MRRNLGLVFGLLLAGMILGCAGRRQHEGRPATPAVTPVKEAVSEASSFLPASGGSPTLPSPTDPRAEPPTPPTSPGAQPQSAGAPPAAYAVMVPAERGQIYSPPGSTERPVGDPRSVRDESSIDNEGEESDAGFDTPDPYPGVLTVSLRAASGSVALGDVLVVDVIASAGVGIVDAPFRVSFDSRLLRFVDAAPGMFLSGGDSTVAFIADGSTVPGDVAVALGRTERSRGANGTGLLCRLRFAATATGKSFLSLREAMAWSVDGTTVPVQVTSGAVVEVR